MSAKMEIISTKIFRSYHLCPKLKSARLKRIHPHLRILPNLQHKKNNKYIIKFLHTGQTKFQILSCMLKLNATVWQQKLNIKDIGGLSESSRQKETGKAKNDP